MNTEQEEQIQNQEQTQKPNQPKEKIIINLRGLGEASLKFQEVLQKCNDKDYGSAVTPTDIFSQALQKFSDADIRSLKRASIKSDLDLLKYEWSKDQLKDEEKVDFNGWLIQKLKLKNKLNELQ